MLLCSEREREMGLLLSVSHGRASAGCCYPSLIMGLLEEERAAAIRLSSWARSKKKALLLPVSYGLARRRRGCCCRCSSVAKRVESRAVGGRPPEPPPPAAGEAANEMVWSMLPRVLGDRWGRAAGSDLFVLARFARTWSRAPPELHRWWSPPPGHPPQPGRRPELPGA
jgi:hypothetical protein